MKYIKNLINNILYLFKCDIESIHNKIKYPKLEILKDIPNIVENIIENESKIKELEKEIRTLAKLNIDDINDFSQQLNNVRFEIKELDQVQFNDIKFEIKELDQLMDISRVEIMKLRKRLNDDKTQDSLNAIDDIIHKSTYGTLKDLIVDDVKDDVINHITNRLSINNNKDNV